MGPGRHILLLGALALACAACGEDTASNAGNSGGGGGRLVSIAQAQDAARQWWSDHERALVERDAKAIASLDAQPVAFVSVEEVRASQAVSQPLLGQPRDPIAVRVHVPAQQSWPVPVLAVFDLHGDKGATLHQAELLVQAGPSAKLAALYSAVLVAPEPAFDTDADGYVRMVAPAAQASALGRSASDLAGLYDGYMSPSPTAPRPTRRRPSPPAATRPSRRRRRRPTCATPARTAAAWSAPPTSTTPS